MADTNELEELIRVNLHLKRDLNPDIFSHLEGVAVKGRAEEIRYLMRLGLLTHQGRMGAVAAPLTLATDPQIEAQTNNQTQSEHSNVSDEVSSSNELSDDPNVIHRDNSDLDFGDDLLSIG